MSTDNNKLRDACQSAILAFEKLNSASYEDICSKLEFCIGSYDFDKNPVGLYEFGQKALDMLKKVKEKTPKKVTQKTLTDLEKALK
jgi:hypothetical protein